MPLTEDRENPHLCPIRLFQTLIFADNAFPNLEPHQLFYTSDFDYEVLELPFRETILDVPIFRKSRSSTEGWSYSGCHGAFVALMERIGHEGVTEYAFRRGAANILISEHYPPPLLMSIEINEYREYNNTSTIEDYGSQF